MKKFLIAAALALSLSACNGDPATDTHAAPDQCIRTQLFQQCLAMIPKGPERTVYNDWAEVVGECESTAYYQSLRPSNVIKPECASSK